MVDCLGFNRKNFIVVEFEFFFGLFIKLKISGVIYKGKVLFLLFYIILS